MMNRSRKKSRKHHCFFWCFRKSPINLHRNTQKSYIKGNRYKKYELTEQSVQFTFGNKRYKSGLKNKTYANVDKDASADALTVVGQAIAGLQDDSLDDTILIQRRRVVESAE